MCQSWAHFSNHLSIAFLSGGVRCHPEQWWYHYSKHYNGLCSQGRLLKHKRQKHNTQGTFRAILSLNEARCSCSTFLLSRYNILWSRQFEKLCKCQNIASACCVSRVLDCQNWVSLQLKIYSKACEWCVEEAWHNRRLNLPNSTNQTNKTLVNEFVLKAFICQEYPFYYMA